MSRRPIQFSGRRMRALAVLLCVFCGLSSRSAGKEALRGEPLLRFAVMADVQYADTEKKQTRGYRESLQELHDCVDALNTNPLSFVVQLGDFIDRDFASFDLPLAEWNRLRAPAWHVLGNHEFNVAAPDKARVLPTLGLERGYTSHTLKGWRFIRLDSTDHLLSRYPAEDPRTLEAHREFDELKKNRAPQAQEWNGGFSGEQVKWLDAELSAADAAGERAVFFCHHPIMPGGTTDALWNADQVRAVIEKHPSSTLWINGHVHHTVHLQSGAVHYWTVSGMVESPGTAYAIVEIYSDHLRISGSGREPSRDLPLPAPARTPK